MFQLVVVHLQAWVLLLHIGCWWVPAVGAAKAWALVEHILRCTICQPIPLMALMQSRPCMRKFLSYRSGKLGRRINRCIAARTRYSHGPTLPLWRNLKDELRAADRALDLHAHGLLPAVKGHVAPGYSKCSQS